MTQTALSRRALLRASAALPAAALAAVPAVASTEASPVVADLPPLLSCARVPTSDLVLMRAEFEYAVLELAAPKTDEQWAPIIEKMNQIEAQMTACVARSLSGLHAKARLLKRMLDTDLCGGEGDDIQELTLSLIDDIGRAQAVEEFEAMPEPVQ